MTTIVVGLVILAAIIAMVAMIARAERRRGRAEAEAEHNQRAAEHAETTGRIMAERRDPERVVDDLRAGRF